MRAGLARITKTDYAPLPTVYDGLFPNGTFLTAPTVKRTPRTNDDEANAEASSEPKR